MKISIAMMSLFLTASAFAQEVKIANPVDGARKIEDLRGASINVAGISTESNAAYFGATFNDDGIIDLGVCTLQLAPEYMEYFKKTKAEKEKANPAVKVPNRIVFSPKADPSLIHAGRKLVVRGVDTVVVNGQQKTKLTIDDFGLQQSGAYSISGSPTASIKVVDSITCAEGSSVGSLRAILEQNLNIKADIRHTDTPAPNTVQDENSLVDYSSHG